MTLWARCERCVTAGPGRGFALCLLCLPLVLGAFGADRLVQGRILGEFCVISFTRNTSGCS